MAVSIIDVSRKSNVAPSTVSVVLNNRSSTVRVSEKTRERILKVARDLGYEPNAIAKSLRMHKTLTIGLVDNTNPMPPNLLQEIEREVSERGFELLIAMGRFQLQYEQAAIKRLLRRKVEGLLILAPAIEPGTRDALESLSKTKFPIVGIGPLMAKGVVDVDWDRGGAFLNITQHLLERGCRAIVFIGSGGTPGRQARIEGVRRAVGERPDTTFSWINPPVLSETGYDDLAKLLGDYSKDKHPDAIICASDDLALAVLRFARERTWRVPEDLAVTGGNDMDWGSWISPALTTVRMPITEIARRAVQRLFDQIEKKANAETPSMELVQAEIIVRESSLFGREMTMSHEQGKP